MSKTFLDIPFREKDAVKALGARWDSDERKWFAPAGMDLAPFERWMSRAPDSRPGTTYYSSEPSANRSLDRVDPYTMDLLDQPAKRSGIPLSKLLNGVTVAVAQAFKDGAWTIVEVVELRVTGGHVYMGISERDAQGSVLAKASAMIWKSVAASILPAFEAATGAQLAPGIKILVRARPVFKAQYGLSIEIDAIDPEYTLGDLEAKKREIRERLRSEGLYDLNRQLESPWDYNSVLVIAPEGGAGLGDFQVEADRLQKSRLCRFTYAYSRFQGEGAASEIQRTTQEALDKWFAAGRADPNAIVVIRGGGAVNDMAWLNDYDLARFFCDLTIPLLTGIGHERDSTILDEVANVKFDTPSKVAAGIEHVIVKRAMEAKAFFESIKSLSTKTIQDAKSSTLAMDSSIKNDSIRSLGYVKERTASFFNGISIDSMRSIRLASDNSHAAIQEVRLEALHQIESVKVNVPALWQEIALNSKHSVKSMKSQGEVLMKSIGDGARSSVREAGIRSKALILEIGGQGPEKTLGRGFAVIRTVSGQALTSAEAAISARNVQIQFRDGIVDVTLALK